MDVSKLHDVYIALGTNLGSKEENIFRAIKQLNERVGMVIVHSAFYITEPVGFQSQNNFINAVCLVMSSLNPLEILTITKEIEKDMGRETKSKDGVYADRIIDIDILLYDMLILESENLVLPHPHLHQRKFVLSPLVELGSQYVHPILNKTIEQLHEELEGQ